MLVLIALTTGMRVAEIFALKWSDVLHREELIAVRSKLKGGKMRYVPMPPELAKNPKRGTGRNRRGLDVPVLFPTPSDVISGGQ
jgi:integrase